MKRFFVFSVWVAIALTSCNERLVETPEESKTQEKSMTYASFSLNLLDPKTYAHSDEAEATPVNDVALFVYKLDGTPEAMVYASSAEYASSDSYGNSNKVTVKCKSGDKLIYLAANLGNQALIVHGYSGTAATEANSWLGQDWSTGGIPFATLNAPVWSTGGAAIAINTPDTTKPGVADGLIKALANAGNPATGDVWGTGTPPYLMTNWGDASFQDTNEGADPDYNATVKFNIKPSIPALDSRSATPDAANANGMNALLINVQRALAKVSLEIASSALATNAAGSGSNLGTFVPDPKWAVGNINTSEYPFQMFDATSVMGTRYNETGNIPVIISVNTNVDWSAQMDNQRWIPATKLYENQNLTVSEVRDRINTGYAGNRQLGSTNFVLVTENNNKMTFNNYSTFVLVSGQYKPASFVTSVSNVGTVTFSSTFPASWPATIPQGGTTDTMYYVQSYGNSGMFFLGIKALQQYIGWSILNLSPSVDPTTNTDVLNAITAMRTTSGNQQANLQAYYQGYCFYRGWIRDDEATTPANKILVRRNHIYAMNVTQINAPGIGDPNDIIDSGLYSPIPTQPADTYVSTTINVLPWHIINGILIFGTN